MISRWRSPSFACLTSFAAAAGLLGRTPPWGRLTSSTSSSKAARCSIQASRSRKAREVTQRLGVLDVHKQTAAMQRKIETRGRPPKHSDRIERSRVARRIELAEAALETLVELGYARTSPLMVSVRRRPIHPRAARSDL